MNSIDIIKNPFFYSIPWISHGISTKFMKYNDANRPTSIRTIQKKLNIPQYPIVYTGQVHSTHFVIIDENFVLNHLKGENLLKDTDGIIVTVPNVTINIFTADCVPIFVIDKKNRYGALVHAGWKGTLHKFLSKIILALINLGSSPSDLYIWMGPSIENRCYEVSVELKNEFRNAFKDYNFTKRDRFLDLKNINKYLAVSEDIPKNQIFASEFCTHCESQLLYSYRRNKKTQGRMISSLTILK